MKTQNLDNTFNVTFLLLHQGLVGKCLLATTFFTPELKGVAEEIMDKKKLTFIKNSWKTNKQEKTLKLLSSNKQKLIIEIPINILPCYLSIHVVFTS